MSKTVRRLATATGISYSPPVPIQYVARSVARHTRVSSLRPTSDFLSIRKTMFGLSLARMACPFSHDLPITRASPQRR
jgi:hypothetical protein